MATGRLPDRQSSPGGIAVSFGQRDRLSAECRCESCGLFSFAGTSKSGSSPRSLSTSPHVSQTEQTETQKAQCRAAVWNRRRVWSANVASVAATGQRYVLEPDEHGVRDQCFTE